MITPITLDRRLTESSDGVSAAFNGTHTTWSLPYAVATNGSEGTLMVVRTSTQAPLTVTRPTSTSVRTAGNLVGVPVTIGVAYFYALQFSLLYPRDQNGRVEMRGRTALRYLRLQYEQATSFTVTVHSTGHSAVTYTFAAASRTVPESGVFTVPILHRNTETTISITATDAGAAGFAGYEWEGTVYTRVPAR